MHANKRGKGLLEACVERKRRLAGWLPTLLLILACLAAPALGADRDPLAGDPRLDARVAVSVEGMAVADALDLLSRKTGIPVSARGEIGDEKIVAFSQPRSLRALLSDVAALLK